MECPLCDQEIGEELISHLDNEHRNIQYVCESCWLKTWPFSSFVKHYHSNDHLYRTGKLSSRIEALEAQQSKLRNELVVAQHKVVAIEAEKLEILQAGYARK